MNWWMYSTLGLIVVILCLFSFRMGVHYERVKIEKAITDHQEMLRRILGSSLRRLDT